jgi:hypothetical protein
MISPLRVVRRSQGKGEREGWRARLVSAESYVASARAERERENEIKGVLACQP